MDAHPLADSAEGCSAFAGHTQLAAPRLADWERPLFEQTMAHVPPAGPVELDRLLRPGDALDWEVGAELIGAAGHPPGQLAVWIPAHRGGLPVLVTGSQAVLAGTRTRVTTNAGV